MKCGSRDAGTQHPAPSADGPLEMPEGPEGQSSAPALLTTLKPLL